MRPPRSTAPAWPHVDKPARTWPALRPVGLMMVVTSARVSVWRAVPAHQTPIWTSRLTFVSPGEQAGLTCVRCGGGQGSSGHLRQRRLTGLSCPYFISVTGQTLVGRWVGFLLGTPLPGLSPWCWLFRPLQSSFSTGQNSPSEPGGPLLSPPLSFHKMYGPPSPWEWSSEQNRILPS